MSIGLPGHLRPQVVARAYNSAAHVTAGVAITAAFLVVGFVQLGQPSLILWPAMLALMPMSTMLWYCHRHPTTLATIAYLAVGTASTYWFALTVMHEYPLSGTDAFLLSAMRVALLLVGSPAGIVHAIGWGAVGLGLAELGIVLAALQAGTTEIAVDTTSLTVFVLIVITMVAVRYSFERSRDVQPTLHRAARDGQLAQVRSRIRSRAAAMTHDTVLGDLAAIAHAADDELSPQLRQQIERDLGVLMGEDWLDDAADDPQRAGSQRPTPLLAAIEETRRLGLVVDVTGDLGSFARLEPAPARALAQAVKQCLVNVLRHAGTDHAEVVVYGSDSELNVMVIDDGDGFDLDAMAPDRLGIRQSVLRRIDAVGGQAQVWSSPGHGTSVLLRIPASAREDAAASDPRAPR